MYRILPGNGRETSRQVGRVGGPRARSGAGTPARQGGPATHKVGAAFVPPPTEAPVGEGAEATTAGR
jgi:hypothetical protein